ncbi:MAG: DUF559 domain-containing protein [Deltaproteobacteria bacterium]|nr:DUF559 domain-containing protein [Deltaproteobacteria bacterium]
MKYLLNDPSAKHRRRRLRRMQTDAEACLWKRLRNKQLERQMAIELDGGQHLGQQAYDGQRTDYLRRHGIAVIRFWDNQVLQETAAVMDSIWAALMQSHVQEGNSP